MEPPLGRVDQAAIRWGVVLLAGAGVTAVSSLLLAVSFLGVLLTYGLGIFLLPVPLALIGLLIWAGGAALRRAGVASPYGVAWLTSLPTIPVAAVVALVSCSVVDADIGGFAYGTLTAALIVLTTGVLGAGSWAFAALVRGPQRGYR
jgi:hypothetical protein